MSTAPPPSLATANRLSSFSQDLTSIGLGYAIAIALGFLLFFCTVLIASYICCRSAVTRRRLGDRTPEESSVYLPRIIFVSEDDDSEPRNDAVAGLDPMVINSYPKFFYAKGNGEAADPVCSICLCEYRESEMLRKLPDCRHCFHVMCVDAWLKLNASCPVCRSSPLSTPLQEVVPLSQYSDGRRRQ